MIVDDSAVFRNRIHRLATAGALPGVEVVGQAGDGVEAIEQARRLRPDAITMDLTMPRMEGPECLKTLSQDLPQARVLVVSALSDRGTALKALRCGAHGFLLKPFSDEQLVDSLRELLA